MSIWGNLKSWVTGLFTSKPLPPSPERSERSSGAFIQAPTKKPKPTKAERQAKLAKITEGVKAELARKERKRKFDARQREIKMSQYARARRNAALAEARRVRRRELMILREVPKEQHQEWIKLLHELKWKKDSKKPRITQLRKDKLARLFDITPGNEWEFLRAMLGSP